MASTVKKEMAIKSLKEKERFSRWICITLQCKCVEISIEINSITFATCCISKALNRGGDALQVGIKGKVRGDTRNWESLETSNKSVFL